MRETTALVCIALIAGGTWCLHRWITAWGEVRRARVEAERLRALAELERPAARPARRARAEAEQPRSNVRVRKG